MININIAYEVPAATVQQIEALVDHEVIHNANLSGAAFNIVRDDFTCIDGNDSDDLDYQELMAKIQQIIAGQ